MTGTSTERKKPSPRSRRPGSANGNPPPPPLQPLLKTVVPHGPPDFSRIRRERADKLSFDVDTLEWHSTPVKVKLDLVPFATGQLRNAYYLQELGADGSPSRLLVAKVSLRPAEPSTYLSDVEMQAVCAHYAALYNEHEPPLKVCYARSWLLKLRDRERGTLVCSVEEFLPGAYVKYSNNSGYVGRETSTTEERERNTPQAFSHFSFVASDFRLMIVDIQESRIATQTHKFIQLMEEALEWGILGLLAWKSFWKVIDAMKSVDGWDFAVLTNNTNLVEQLLQGTRCLSVGPLRSRQIGLQRNAIHSRRRSQ
ncbi:hypothetical protein AM588_10006779 [Phytophthora nicotianae]|uniref:Alpha-type protein kinase domain-containing protein n=1 Tax=Phytophthora nicotianae TaxID=4792 RepID=A0A0W8DCD7_PHYNI|nr:hypothetical protein AM588_10006779 [Phytophthora nicotianae]